MHELVRSNPAGRQMQFGWIDGTEIEDHTEDADNMHNEDFVPDKHIVSSSNGRITSETEGSNTVISHI